MSSECRHLEALAFCITVDAIRKAKGKQDPRDLKPGSIERIEAEVDMMNDTLRMMGIDPGKSS